jgi:hypothetical protein
VLEMLNDHRQSLAGTFAEAAERALWLLSDRPHLLVKEEYSRQYTCEKCCEYAPFRLAEPDETIAVLGYR